MAGPGLPTGPGSAITSGQFTVDIMWFGKKRNPEENRYYLLPGQGRSNRRKHRLQLLGALIAGGIFAALIGAVMWFMNSPR